MESGGWGGAGCVTMGSDWLRWGELEWLNWLLQREITRSVRAQLRECEFESQLWIVWLRPRFWGPNGNASPVAMRGN